MISRAAGGWRQKLCPWKRYGRIAKAVGGSLIGAWSMVMSLVDSGEVLSTVLLSSKHEEVVLQKYTLVHFSFL